MSKPIPRKLLIHSATLSHVTGTDEYGVDTLTETTPRYARFEPTKRTNLTGLGESRNDKYLMFYDCTNSAPSGQTFAQEDHIVYNGVTLTIRKVDEESDERGLHHYEVYLT